MDNKNQSQRLKGNFMNNKLKQFLSEINNKKEIIRSFKKRYIILYSHFLKLKFIY